MQNRETLRLQPGDWIIYGDSQWSQRVRRWRIGRVQHVTQRGGIKLCGGVNVVRKEESPDEAAIRHFS
jgi:hypothetical protein